MILEALVFSRASSFSRISSLPRVSSNPRATSLSGTYLIFHSSIFNIGHFFLLFTHFFVPLHRIATLAKVASKEMYIIS